jgi:1-acyl-sn-glycerol-3-phosphate acyltransferase
MEQIHVIASILLWVWVLVWGTIIALSSSVLFIVFNPWVDPKRKVMLFMSGLWGWGVLLYVRLFLRVTIEGREKITGACIICPNHDSIADIITFLGVLPSFAFVAQSYVFQIPPLSIQARLSDYVRAESSEGGERVVEHCVTWLRRGVPLLMFPEGTRSPDGEIKRFRQGPFVVAQKAQVPIVPVAITGTRTIIAKGAHHFTLKGRVIVKVLDPFMVEGTPKEAAQRARAAVQKAKDESLAQVPLAG